MPTYDTPGPITAYVDLPIGELRIVASDRTDTTVEVRCDSRDRAEADAVSVELDGDELTVRGRKLGLRSLLVPTPGRTLEVEIALPTGSALSARTGYGNLTATGRLGTCRAELSYGDARLESAEAVVLSTGYGQVRVTGDVTGDAEVNAAHGTIRLHRVGGSAELRTKHAVIHVDEVDGPVALTGVHGDMEVDVAAGDVHARSAYGAVRIGRVSRGSVSLTSTHGLLEVGVDPASAVWLDADTRGRVSNALTPREGPEGFTESVAVHARSREGDIVVHRA